MIKWLIMSLLEDVDAFPFQLFQLFQLMFLVCAFLFFYT